MKPLEMWGGVECAKRLSNLALFTALGIKKLRYPCLWELVAPKDLDHCNWSNLDERLGELKRLNQDFIAGFFHHGSGPFYTSLIDPDFPGKLATYARHFATRYPWVNDFTPINEINSTARFSVLDGQWYPFKAIILQCKGTALAMREIRRINPKARLIQTDKCDFKNERKWLTWDLLCGKVTEAHPLYRHMIDQGISIKELQWFEENPCPPDIIGLNPASPEATLHEAWERYHITLAITECQMNQLNQICKTSFKLQNEGVKIEAVTLQLLATNDIFISPTNVRDLANKSLDL